MKKFVLFDRNGPAKLILEWRSISKREPHAPNYAVVVEVKVRGGDLHSYAGDEVKSFGNLERPKYDAGQQESCVLP